MPNIHKRLETTLRIKSNLHENGAIMMRSKKSQAHLFFQPLHQKDRQNSCLKTYDRLSKKSLK